jgi:1-acyl-sn-glycerol-3-phosphate acyltransferase
MNRLARTVFAGAATVGLTAGLSGVVSALSLIDPKYQDPVLHFWALSVLASAGVKHQVRGLENLPPGNFVLVANHLSNFDALVLFAHIRRHMRFVAKAQLKKVPILGFALQRAGNIFVDRKGSSADRETLQEAVHAVRNTVSVVFFAEGTRSEDGVLRPFKKGAAIMAIEAQVPMVPVAIAGTHLILQKGSMVIHPHPAALVIGTPIDTAGLQLEARDELTQRAHASVAASLAIANDLVAEMKREG